MIQAAFFDIDGTLLDHTDGKSVFPKSTAAALAALQRKGVKVFVSTGRAPAMLDSVRGLSPSIRELFPFDGFATFNGQLVLERDGTVIHRMSHDPENIRKLIPLAQKEQFPCFVLEEVESFPLTDHPSIRQHYQWMGIPFPPFYDAARLSQHPVIQFNIYMPLEKAVPLLAPLEGIEVTSSGGDILDVIPKGGGKETGLNAVIQHYGYQRENTIAFGDGINDIRMLQWAGTSVAMGNAPDSVKEAADFVTSAVSDNGIRNALLHLGILEKSDFLP